MGKTLFVVSDIHGYYRELMQALADAGFDRDNEDHLFISCGDLFDRGQENRLVYDFVRSLPRKILLRGNHEDMLYQVLEQGYLEDFHITNGTDITLREFLGEDALDAHGRFDREAHLAIIRELQAFIDAMADYYESGVYIFTHGWLPVAFDGRYPYVREDFRDATLEEWQFAHEQEWQQFYDVGAVLDGKTIVCGHRAATLGHMFDPFRFPDCSKPFYGTGMIAIDAGTVRSGRINVLVIREDT
ncbi:MAG: metallophosphoesterase [Clostridia bacterium]|nr:metallophosphoesterase [Clostridia bacterium]